MLDKKWRPRGWNVDKIIAETRDKYTGHSQSHNLVEAGADAILEGIECFEFVMPNDAKEIIIPCES